MPRRATGQAKRSSIVRIARSFMLPAGLAFLLIVVLAACSSDDEGGASSSSGAAPAAAASDSGTVAGSADEGGRYRLKQTFVEGIELTSPVFNRIRRIPKTHVCPGRPPRPGAAFEQDALTRYADRKNISPPLEWTGIPEGTQSFALLMDSDQVAHAEDPDARWTHWLIWNLPADTAGLAERVATTTEVVDLGPSVLQGTNDDKVIGYSGPCPLPVTVCYREVKPKVVFNYEFHVYALDAVLDLPGGATRVDFLKAIDGHILSSGVINGEFVASRQLLEF